MESLLDDAAACRRCDKGGMLETLGLLPEHLERSLALTASGVAPIADRIDHVLVCGMGGSAIGGDLVQAWLGSGLKAPLAVHRGPAPPGPIGPRTLVLVCSYSGDTRETLAAFERAWAAGARIVCVSCNGKLQQRARETGSGFAPIPGGMPPRAAVAFLTVTLALALHRSGLLADPADELRAVAAWLRTRRGLYGIENPASQNPAKRLAERLRGRVAVVHGAQDRLSAVATRWAGQFAENSKQWSFSRPVPEITHNDIVGWKHPAEALKFLSPVFLRDADDPPLVGLQIELLLDQFGSQVDCLEIWTASDATWPARLWDLLWLGDYASVYLAFLNGEDPTPVQPIDRLKTAMKAKPEAAETA